jgi:hypothetical protein
VAAKKLDRRLAALGARAAAPRGLGDDQAPAGHEAALDAWLPGLWAALRAAAPLPPGLADVRRLQPWFACRGCLCRAILAEAARSGQRRLGARRPPGRAGPVAAEAVFGALRAAAARPGRCARWLS